MPGLQNDIAASGLSPLAALAINGQGLAAQTALGSTQATAYVVPQVSSVEFTTVAAGTGAVLPGLGGKMSAGDIIAIYNQGANALLVYPPVGFRIGTSANNASLSVPAGKAALFGFRGDGNYLYFLSA